MYLLLVSHLAAEALRVPLGAQGCHVALHDGLVAALAAGGKLLVVALSAEGLAVLLVETLGPKVLAAEGAEEVLRVPGLVQGTHHTLRERERGEIGGTWIYSGTLLKGHPCDTSLYRTLHQVSPIEGFHCISTCTI